MTSTPHPDPSEPSNPFEPPRAPLPASTSFATPRAPDPRPDWVRWGLWGAFGWGRTRRSARQMMGFTLLWTVPGLALGVWPGVVALACAAWIALAIRWMDRHRAW